jgi:hypothetical protein
MSKNTVKRLSTTVAAFLLLGGAARVAYGQDSTVITPDSAGDRLPTLTVRAPNSYGGWIAGVRNSAFRTRTGSPGHRDFFLASFRAAWVLGDEKRPVSGRYFVDVIPMAVSTGMPEYLWNNRCQPDTLCPGATPILHNAYAFGITPLGWALAFNRGPASLTLEASGGGLWFSRRIPDPLAARFNFTASAGPTLELRMTSSEALRIGYLWHHTSNGGTGKVNPGMNSGILAVGMLWRGAPHHEGN